MELNIYHQNEERDRRLSVLLAFLIHLLLFVLLLLPFLRFPIPPPGQVGILVSFGEEFKGGDASSSTSSESDALTQSTDLQEQLEEEKSQTTEELSGLDSKITTEEKSPVVVNPDKKSNSTQKSAEEIRKEREAAEAARKAEEEAQKQAEYEQAKEEFGDLFGEGSGEDAGKQGDPQGDPDSSVLEGISSGTGRVGGGLSNRGLLFEPDIRDNSQKEGRVVIRICVDQSGKVISAKFTQRGSTTTDADLVKIALESSKKYIFSMSELEEQCGTITVDFKLI